MCSLLPIGHLEGKWKTRILCSFFAAVGGIQISKSLHLNLNATRSQDWLWCLLDMWASKTSWIKVPTMGRLCLRNFFCSSDLKIFLLAKCSLTPPVGEHWRSLNNTRTAIALHWERFYPSHLKKVNCSSEIHSTSSSQNYSVRKMRIHQILCSHIDKLITYILISSLLGRTSKDFVVYKEMSSDRLSVCS